MNVLDLNGIWLLKDFDAGKGEEEGAFEVDHDEAHWMKARVPGVVHLDLIRLHKISHPFYGMNEDEARWVEDKDWWYRKRFDVAEGLLNSDRAELTLEGLDTFAGVWLNGRKVGDFDNMFYEHSIDVKGWLKEGGNVMAIKFASPRRILEERYGRGGVKLGAAFYPPRVYGRKAQYSFGWDWGPRLPTSGIGRRAQIRGFGTCAIGSTYFRSLLEGPGGAVRATVEVTLRAFREEEVVVTASLKGHGYMGTKEERRRLSAGENRFAFELAVEDAKLWWPNGLGEQALYSLEVVVAKDGTALDRRQMRVGLRKIEVVRERDEEGESFYFKVNGVPIFCKGANWVPADSFLPQVMRGRYDQLLSRAREAHMNMLRVWGGGVYEGEDFYELCDEKGLLIWQDFMFACAEYPEEGWFFEAIRKEAEEVVKRLRNHPCLALWCGNNENDWGVKANWFGKKDKFYGQTIYHQILPEICGRLDPSTFYWPSSPYGGDDPNSQGEGDRHSWDVWSGLRDYGEYLRDNGRFVSEFGFQSMPSMATIMKCTPPSERYPQSKVMEHHNKQEGGPERLAFFLAHHFKVPGDLRTFAYLTQVNQGEAMKAGVMHWRRRKFRSAGALIWQLDDCWPVASWSLIDYYGDLKASYYYTKRAFDDLALSLVLNGEAIEAWAVNDLLEESDGRLEIAAFRTDGAKIFGKTVVVKIPGNASALVMKVPLSEVKAQDPSKVGIVGILKVQGQGARYDTIILDQWKHIKFIKPNIKIVAVKPLDKGGRRFRVKVSANALVKACKLEVRGMKAILSDNCFDMIPRVERALEVELERPLKLSELRKRLQFLYYR